ncbi:MAG: dTDP-glucose 4,6-dehydratase [Firmicutes bacterium]|nr:dTDP-glucose 4,6-dehydratase [Bacillota bacterium]
MRVLVTGGAGFIGSNFIRYCLRVYPDWYVVNFDKLTYAGNLENLAGIDEGRYSFVRGDIADPVAVEAVFSQGFDVVVNFAAESHVDRSILDPAPFMRTNVLGTQVLLDAARSHGVVLLVQVSTDEVYGSLEECEPPFTEDSPLAPNSPYAASKAAADMLARAWWNTYRVPVIITRCCNNFGPYQFPEKLIPLVITNAIQDLPIPVYGDGRNIRDWIHVEDHCRAIAAVIERGSPGEIYNIGAGCEVRNIDLVRRILLLLGKSESLIQFVSDRPGHDRRYAIDASRIRRELGWVPTRPLAEALPEVIDWYVANEGWWRRVRSGAYRDYYEAVYSRRWGGGLE